MELENLESYGDYDIDARFRFRFYPDEESSDGIERLLKFCDFLGEDSYKVGDDLDSILVDMPVFYNFMELGEQMLKINWKNYIGKVMIDFPTIDPGKSKSVEITKNDWMSHFRLPSQGLNWFNVGAMHNFVNADFLIYCSTEGLFNELFQVYHCGWFEHYCLLPSIANRTREFLISRSPSDLAKPFKFLY